MAGVLRTKKGVWVFVVIFLLFCHSVKWLAYFDRGAPQTLQTAITSAPSAAIQGLDNFRSGMGEAVQKIEIACPLSVRDYCRSTILGLRVIAGIN